MSLASFFGGDKLPVSFELFPPKTEKGLQAMFGHLEKLLQFNPDFVTCTYGAGGSTRDTTLEIVKQVKAKYNIPVASHLTLVDATKDQLRSYLTAARAAGIDYIVALRGDPPSGRSYFQAAEGGLRYANELVDLIRAEFNNFGVAVAGYPEVHLEATDMQSDLDNLKRKVDAGADIIITQLFYDNADFYSFRERCEKAGISVPIVPGILPALSLKQVRKITRLCGSKLPEEFETQLAEKPEDADWQKQVGIDHAANQVKDLVANQVSGLHFYVLNKSAATDAILKSLS